MKIVMRTLLIVVAALIVSGATFAFSRTSAATSMDGPPRGQFERRPAATTDGAVTGDQQNTAPQFDSAGPPEEFRRERVAGGLFGLVDVGGKFLVIALIVAAVSFFSRLTRLLQARLAARRKPSPPASTA